MKIKALARDWKGTQGVCCERVAHGLIYSFEIRTTKCKVVKLLKWDFDLFIFQQFPQMWEGGSPE